MWKLKFVAKTLHTGNDKLSFIDFGQIVFRKIVSTYVRCRPKLLQVTSLASGDALLTMSFFGFGFHCGLASSWSRSCPERGRPRRQCGAGRRRRARDCQGYVLTADDRLRAERATHQRSPHRGRRAACGGDGRVRLRRLSRSAIQPRRVIRLHYGEPLLIRAHIPPPVPAFDPEQRSTPSKWRVSSTTWENEMRIFDRLRRRARYKAANENCSRPSPWVS